MDALTTGRIVTPTLRVTTTTASNDQPTIHHFRVTQSSTSSHAVTVTVNATSARNATEPELSDSSLVTFLVTIVDLKRLVVPTNRNGLVGDPLTLSFSYTRDYIDTISPVRELRCRAEITSAVSG